MAETEPTKRLAFWTLAIELLKTLGQDTNFIPAKPSVQYQILEADTVDNPEDDWDKWCQPRDRKQLHPWDPSLFPHHDPNALTPASISIHTLHFLESTYYLLLMNSLTHPTLTFEPQYISPNYVSMLEELNSFFCKAAGIYAIADMRGKSDRQPRQGGLSESLYGEWFNLVGSDSPF